MKHTSIAALLSVALIGSTACSSDDEAGSPGENGGSGGVGGSSGAGGSNAGTGNGGAAGGGSGGMGGTGAGAGTGATGGSAGTSGSAGAATGGSAGNATGGTAGAATGGTAGAATGGTAGAATGGAAGAGTGGAGTGGTAGATFVSTAIAAAITQQLSPLELDEPAVVQIGTYSWFPIELRNPRVTVPSGWRVASITEDLTARNCPTGTGGKRCRQYFTLTMYSDPACEFDGSYKFDWDVGCAPGGDCSAIDPSFSTFSATANLASENFCDTLPPVTFARFFPSAGMLLPTTGTAPFTMRVFTTLDHPYKFDPDTVSVPPGFSLVSFTEDTAARECDTSQFPNACRQWWNIVVSPGAACSPRGDYNFTWNVSCDSAGNCDPSISAYTTKLALTEDRDLCP